ncbi:MAG: protein of unknown function with transrane region [Candidatus Taylorbacteria bacterium]|nr:protein of unknown function with transrane region [Candidatus Taylorbacteria bacterium]
MKTNATQIIILGIFILFLVTGVIVFAKFSTSSNTNADATQVVIWGTVPEGAIANVLDVVSGQKMASINIAYKEIPANNFEQTLIESLADGYGPDAVLLPNTLLLKNQRKFTVISTDALSARTFQDTFVEGAEPLMTSKGTYGVPLLVDPLVMYWNRNILTSKNVARPPQTWEEVLSLTNLLTERRDDRSILKSTVAMGDYSNVAYSKDILLALTMQAGGVFVGRDSNDRAVNLLNADSAIDSLSPFSASLTFFTQFSDPLKSVYSWNRSLPDSEKSFINGDLAFYFGHASDAGDIRAKNPNLNFDIAPLPQPKDSAVKVTSGTMYSFSILATSKNQQAAFNNISVLTSAPIASLISSATGLPPARRDLLSASPGTSFGDVFWESALWTKTWLDPDPIQTSIAFAQGVDDIVTGKSKPADSAKLISQQVDELLK